MSGIQVAKGGCVVGGKAEVGEGVSLLQLDDKLREKLQLASVANQLIANAGQTYAKEIADGVNAAIAAIEALAKKINEKKQNTRKILADANVEDLAGALNNCTDIATDTKAMQDSLHAMICKIEAGKIKANLTKIKAAYTANIEFMNKLGPALNQCNPANNFKPWKEEPCKGPCGWEVEVYVLDTNGCRASLDRAFNLAKKLKKCPQISDKLNDIIESASERDFVGGAYFRDHIQDIKQKFSEFPKLCFEQRMRIIYGYVNFTGLGDDYEKIVLEAIKTTPTADIQKLFVGLSTNLKKLFKGVDDKTFWIGDDNYTELRKILFSQYLKVCGTECTKTKAKTNSNNLFIGYNGGYYKRIIVEYINDKIRFRLFGSRLVPGGNGTVILENKEIYKTLELSPFTDLVNIVVVNDEDGVFSSFKKGTVTPLPVFLLAWMAEKQLAKELVATAEVAADVVGLAIGATELKIAFKVAVEAKKIWSFRNVVRVGLALGQVIPPASRLFAKPALKVHLEKKYGEDAKGMLENYDTVINTIDLITGLEAAYNFCKIFKKNKVKFANDPYIPKSDYDELAAQEAKMEKACEDEGLSFDGVSEAGSLTSLLAKWDNLTIAEAKKLYAQLIKTEIKGSKTAVTQSSILAEINSSSSLVNPYNFAHSIDDIILNQEALFVRVHKSWNPNRPWLISLEEFRTFANQDDMIKKLALPILGDGGKIVKPVEISIVKLPAGTKIRQSVARPQDWPGQGHQPGGAIQFEITENSSIPPEWFKPMGKVSDYLN